MKTKILVADDQPEVRSALRLLLEQESTWEVVGESSDAEDLINTIRKSCPDVVLLDWELPSLRAEVCMKMLRETCSNMRVVALSSQVDARKGALGANVDAFVSKGDPPEKVLDTLHTLIGPPQEGSKKGEDDG